MAPNDLLLSNQSSRASNQASGSTSSVLAVQLDGATSAPCAPQVDCGAAKPHAPEACIPSTRLVGAACCGTAGATAMLGNAVSAPAPAPTAGMIACKGALSPSRLPRSSARALGSAAPGCSCNASSQVSRSSSLRPGCARTAEAEQPSSAWDSTTACRPQRGVRSAAPRLGLETWGACAV